MRPKIVIAVLLAGIIGLAGIFFLKHLTVPARPVPPPVASQPVTPAASVATNAKPVRTVVILADAPVVKTTSRVAVDTNTLAGEHEASVQAEINKLDDLEANDDADSLHTILGDLTNSDKEIRAAAVESTIQFGSRDAIPVLKNLAARTEDPDEKKNLLDAADFLALPKLSEPDPPNASPAPPQP